jgi:peptidyl-prolyl cis-trans isomerase D
MMMKWFRKKRNFRIVMGVTAFLVIPGFVIWGVSISGSGGSALAARVGRQAITKQQYYQVLEETERQYREMFKENYGKLMEKVQLDRIVLESLINQKLLEQECRKRHLNVSSSEILAAIKSNPAFADQQGKFDEAKFRNYFSQATPEEMKGIEQQVRQSILLQKLRQEVLSETTITVSDDEVKKLVAKDSKPEDAERIRKVLQNSKEEKYFQDWLAKQRQNTKIEIYITFAPKHEQ